MTDYILNKQVIDDWKRSRDKSDAHLAVACDVDPATVKRWLNGVTKLPYSAVKALEELTGIPDSQLAIKRPQGMAS